MIFGADISEWQGIPKWDVLAKWLEPKPLQFFMLRTEDGLHKDGKFSAYCMGLNSIGFYDLGTYMFFRASKPVADQVRMAVEMHGDLPGPLAVDIESIDGMMPEQVADRLTETLQLVTTQTGRLPMIYTDPGDWSSLGPFGRSHHFERYPLWVATIGSKPVIPSPFAKCDMWQYTWKREVPGFSALVDGDCFYGTLDEWKAIGRPVVPDTEPAPTLDKDPDSTPTGH